MLVWIIISIVVVYYIIGLLLPANTTIAVSLKMTGNHKSIYNTVLDFRNWENWAIWNDDRTLEVIVSDPPNEVGARYRWRSKIKELKDGLVVLTEASPNNLLEYEWYYGKRKRGSIVFNIEELDNCSFVTCSMTIHNKRKIFARYFSLLIRKALYSNIEEVLLKIDERSM